MPAQQSYQLHIQLARPASIQIGRLGRYSFPAGQYIYTGSAKRNLEARIQRHLSMHKKVYWHIDYLTTHPGVRIVHVERFSQEECRLNQKVKGEIFVPGFGAGDCRSGCGGHLKFISELRLSSPTRSANAGRG